MIQTERKPISPGEILREEFLVPLRLTQGQLAQAMGVPRKHVNQLCRDRRSISAATALLLARAFDTSPDFWLNLQRRMDLWIAAHSDRQRLRLAQVRPVITAVRRRGRAAAK